MGATRIMAMLTLTLATASGTGQGDADGLPSEPAGTAQAAIQMLADVTLIDAQCSTVAVSFGAAFQAAKAMGVNPVDVMPAGASRAAFEAAYLRRFNGLSQTELCGRLVSTYAAAIPGLFTPR